jgi:hypothetical protein
VPDPYAATNAKECLAQATVVAVYNVNIAGGFESVEPNHDRIAHQYTTLQFEAQLAGQGNSIFVPGENIPATHRLPNSEPVPMVDGFVLADLGPAPDVSIKSNVTLVDTSHRTNPHSGCNFTT